MIQTSLTRLLGIAHPVIQGSFGPWPALELAAAVSEAGGLGSLGTATKDAGAVEREIAALRERTEHPFAVNHTLRPFSEDAYAATLRAPPPVVSMALGCDSELLRRAHEMGCLVVQQVHSVEQAGRGDRAAGRGRCRGRVTRSGVGRDARSPRTPA